MVEIGRLLTAMATPFDRGGEIDFNQAGRLARALLDSGSDGLVVAGTTGEAPTLTTKEKWQLFATVKKATGGRGAVVAGTGNYNTAESIELSREAERIGVDALLLTVPYYNKPSQEGLFRHFEAIARNTTLPCILYNVPSRTVTDMSAETTIRLSHIPNIIGIKEASGNLAQISSIIQGARGDFRVWSGNDEDTLPVLAIGGYGVVSVLSHLVGAQIQQMIQAFVNGSNEKAAEIHRRLLPLVKAMFLIGNPAPLKYALNQSGFNVGEPRLPLVPPDEPVAAKIREALAAQRLDLPVTV
ncbi:MAG TPA: 4-hydroxy-tetrahydrodipicolinate synthase [Dehalococcoidia bacterium]|nr:4-hydroxy-tetrahydrodipicolinate synthase [Dehalococcoidia bacterium]